MRLPAFTGTWAVERDITDLRGGRSGRFTGRAEFRPAPDGLAYVETGTLVLGGVVMAATRSYLWREAAGCIEVRFDDGHPFHAFPADDLTPEASHDCPPDRYRVRYDFADWPRWQVEWRVTGQRKDYLSRTRFARPQAAASVAHALDAEA